MCLVEWNLCATGDAVQGGWLMKGIKAMAGDKKRAWVRPGFTLLELLVVILIVAVAVAFLYPVFAQVREKGRQTACLSQVSQHARAVLMYADDYDERLPVAWNRPGYGTEFDESSYPRWWNVVEPYLKSDEVLHCPDDAGYLGMRPGDPVNNHSFYEAFGSSYSSFIGWLPVNDTSFAVQWPRFPGGLGGISLAAVLDPTRAALSYDSWPYWHAGTRDPELAITTDAVVLNVSFLDGSARRRSSRYLTTYLAMGPDAAEESRTLALGDRPEANPPRLASAGGSRGVRVAGGARTRGGGRRGPGRASPRAPGGGKKAPPPGSGNEGW